MTQILIECLYNDDEGDPDDDDSDDDDGDDEHPDTDTTTKVMVRHSYMEIADDSLRGMAIIARCCIQAHSFTIAIMYLQTMGAILYELLQQVIPLSNNAFLAIIVCASLVFVFISTLSMIAFLSLWALVSLSLLTFSVGYYCITERDSWQSEYLNKLDIMNLMYASSIIVSNFGSQFFIIDVYKSMKTPEYFSPVLNASAVISVIFFVAISLPAAVLFGSTVNEFVNLSVPPGILNVIVNVTFLLKSFLSLPFAIYICDVNLPQFRFFDNYTQWDLQHWVSCVRRAVLILVAYLLAVILPSYSVLLNISGGTVMVLVELILPACFHLKLKNKLSRLQVAMDLLLILFGIFVSSVTIINVVLKLIT